MNINQIKITNRKAIIKLKTGICETAEELISSDLFFELIKKYIAMLEKRDSYLLGIFEGAPITDEKIHCLTDAILSLVKIPIILVPNVIKGSEHFLKDPAVLNEFIEQFYNYWRSFDRFIICDSSSHVLTKRPYRTINATIEKFTQLIRGVYRDIQENITGSHPQIYRQVHAGAEVATIAIPYDIQFPSNPAYQQLKKIDIIRHVVLYPPLVLTPPNNTRSGKFERISQNPLTVVTIKANEWLCYPAKVGPLNIFIYFHEAFFELGFSLCNLFELADENDLKKKPDAVFLFGVPENSLNGLGTSQTVFYEDEKTGMLVGAVPNNDEFGYFGYLKKMALTLHNIRMMRLGKLPFHGALVKVLLKSQREAVILVIGDTGAGKSETLEAFQDCGQDEIRDLIIIADDMGSLDISSNGTTLGYGTEIGAFLRLDDLQPWYAFRQIDRAIIMNPNKVNARLVLPVTTFEAINKGVPIDYVLYANNYEEIDEEHPIIEQFKDVNQALPIFRDGTVMSKGTTTSKGLVHSYFANVFGPTQYKELHESLAKKFFESFFDKGLFVGQIRTRLGIPGWERKGPEASAKELLKVINKQ